MLHRPAGHTMQSASTEPGLTFLSPDLGERTGPLFCLQDSVSRTWTSSQRAWDLNVPLILTSHEITLKLLSLSESPYLRMRTIIPT